MVSSSAKTVDQYLASLPADRRAAIEVVRETVNRHLPEGYEEGMLYGMLGWYVPLAQAKRPAAKTSATKKTSVAAKKRGAKKRR